jgi:hypothetical protein
MTSMLGMRGTGRRGAERVVKGFVNETRRN